MRQGFNAAGGHTLCAGGVGRPRIIRWRRAFITSSLLLSLVAGGVLLLPTLILQTSLRNQLLINSLTPDGYSSASGAAAGGWLAPIRFEGIVLRDPAARVDVRVDEIQLQTGLLGILFGPRDLGQVDIYDTSVRVRLDEDGNWPIAINTWSLPYDANLIFHGTSVRVLRDEGTNPMLHMRPPHVDVVIASDADGNRSLTVRECVVQDDELVRTITRNPLGMIAPVLSQVTRLRATATITTDPIVIPLRPDQSDELSIPPLTGRAEVHMCEARLKEDWMVQLMRLLDSQETASLPDRLTMAENTVIRFEVRDGAVHHESMAFLLPELASGLQGESSGRIGFDESVDVDLKVRLPGSLTENLPGLADVFASRDIELRARVTGTVAVPELDLPPFDELMRQATAQLLQGDGSSAPPVQDAVIQLIRGASEDDPDKARRSLTGGIFGLVRAISESKKQKEADQAADPKRPVEETRRDPR